MHWAVPNMDRMIKKEQKCDDSVEASSVAENPSQHCRDMLLPSGKTFIDARTLNLYF